eukprot:gene18213-23878_t
MSEKIDESWLFIVEWYDPLPQLKKTYLLKYYVDSHMVEMVDVRNKKLFLKKSPLTKDISPSEFFVGGKVLLYSRELDIVDYEEFLEVYKGVIPDFSDHVVQLSNGLSVALEVRAEDAVNTFRITAGPWDIGMAKELYPTSSIRGLYGIDNVKNAIHSTDLPQDAVMECQYCFSLMDT